MAESVRGRWSCGNAIVPGGPAPVYPPPSSRSDTGSCGKNRPISKRILLPAASFQPLWGSVFWLPYAAFGETRSQRLEVALRPLRNQAEYGSCTLPHLPLRVAQTVRPPVGRHLGIDLTERLLNLAA